MEQERKEEMNVRPKPDSFSIGTAGKGGSLKVYFDLSNLEESQQKLDNFIRAKKYLADKFGLNIGGI